MDRSSRGQPLVELGRLEADLVPLTLRRRALRIGILLGVGLVGTLDGTVVHELLQWHRLYVETTQFWQVFIDGLFHLGTALLLFVGAIMVWRQRGSLARLKDGGTVLTAGILLGMGAFNLFDGTVQHKLLGLHPVRLGVENQLPYDLAWNGSALILLALGWWLWRRADGSNKGNSPNLR